MPREPDEAFDHPCHVHKFLWWCSTDLQNAPLCCIDRNCCASVVADGCSAWRLDAGELRWMQSRQANRTRCQLGKCSSGLKRCCPRQAQTSDA